MGNGIVAIYRWDDGEETKENKLKIEAYLDYLMNFNSEGNKEYLETLAKKYAEAFKGLSESKKKNFRNWKSGRNIPARDKLIELCFDLGIRNLDEINELMYSFNHDALHLRNVKEICYYFALNHDIDYEDAERYAQEQDDRFRGIYGTDAGESKRSRTGLYTSVVKFQIEQMHTKEELEDYIEERRSQLGDIKVTAYRKFRRFVDEADAEEEKRSTDEPSFDDLPRETIFMTENPECEELIHKIYDSMGFPPNGGITKYRWKSAKKRTESVSRGIFIMYAMKEIIKEYVNTYQPVDTESFTKRINTELKECTFAELNPRRCLWDRIVCDCIEAAFDEDLFEVDEYRTIYNSPYDLLNNFFDYLK